MEVSSFLLSATEAKRNNHSRGKIMATTRLELETERQGGQSISSQSPQQSAIQNGGRRRDTQTGEGQSLGKLGALMNINEEQLARGLGWFSLGLGLAELLAPGGVAKVAGLRGKNRGLIRLFGLREIASGVAIFMQGKRPAAALWSRVAGDALDIACLGASFASTDSDKGRLAFATANVLTVTALDVICAQALSGDNESQQGGTQVRKSLIINRTPEELYQFWHDFENLPRFMTHLESVTVIDERRSHWVAKAPAGSSVEWDAEITEDRPNELIAWRSEAGADVENSGSVSFEPAPGGRGTIVRVEMDYNPPGGVLGAFIAKLFGEEPGQQAQAALRSFKQLMETGEVIVSEGTVWDNGLLTQRPAQPLTDEDLAEAQRAGAAQV